MDLKDVLMSIALWVWQLPQNLLGWIYKQSMADIITVVNQHDYFKIYLTRNKTDFALGKYLFATQDHTDKSEVIRRLTDKSIESVVLGPFFLVYVMVENICNLLDRD